MEEYVCKETSPPKIPCTLMGYNQEQLVEIERRLRALYQEQNGAVYNGDNTSISVISMRQIGDFYRNNNIQI